MVRRTGIMIFADYFRQKSAYPDFPVIDPGKMLERLRPPSGKIRMVLDTDTFNEIDDQFAVVYAMKSKEKIKVEAFYAAPFYCPEMTAASSSPGDGMEKSRTELVKIMDLLKTRHKGFVFKGADSFLKNLADPITSPAALDLINRAMSGGEDRLYVVSIGAITNIASAILIEPGIIERIVVVWLGGEPLHYRSALHFNLMQDILASKLILDCGVPLVHIPCGGVASHMITTLPEIEKYVKGKGIIGDYLYEIFKEHSGDRFAYSRVLWDLAAIAYLVNPEWVPTDIMNSPVLTDELTWSFDRRRHFIRNALFVHRDQIFYDFFKKLESIERMSFTK